MWASRLLSPTPHVRTSGGSGSSAERIPAALHTLDVAALSWSVRVGRQVAIKALQQKCGATGLTGGRVCVVEDRAQTPVGEEMARTERHTEREEGQHEWITLACLLNAA